MLEVPDNQDLLGYLAYQIIRIINDRLLEEIALFTMKATFLVTPSLALHRSACLPKNLFHTQPAIVDVTKHCFQKCIVVLVYDCLGLKQPQSIPRIRQRRVCGYLTGKVCCNSNLLSLVIKIGLVQGKILLTVSSP